MNGIDLITLPKFLDGEPIPTGYFDAPNPYVNAPSCHVDLPALARYARMQGKKLTDLTKEDMQKFAVA